MADDRGDFKIAHVAGLARLRLTADEEILFQKQLGDILAFATQVQAVATDAVPALTTEASEWAAARPDAVTPSLPAEEAAANAPDAQTDPVLFRVPKVLG